MGILDFVEKAAGALAAEKAVEATDANAGLFEKAAAALAGYEGVAAVKEHFEKPTDTPIDSTVAAVPASPAPDQSSDL